MKRIALGNLLVSASNIAIFADRLAQFIAENGHRRGNLTEGLYIGLDYEKVYFV
ncbi:hypothetical protein ACWM9A_06115 [Acetobacter pasteurianus]